MTRDDDMRRQRRYVDDTCDLKKCCWCYLRPKINGHRNHTLSIYRPSWQFTTLTTICCFDSLTNTMGKRTHTWNAHKAVHKLNSSSVKNNKSTCSQNCGPSDHGRNVAPQISSHNNGPRYVPTSNQLSSQQRQIGCILPEFDASHSQRKHSKQNVGDQLKNVKNNY